MASYTWHNVPWLRTAVVSHKQKVKSLYKRACRTCDDWYSHFPRDRGHAIIQKTELRARFDANKNIKDLRKAKVLLLEGEAELWNNLHPVPIRFPWSPGGICYERYGQASDNVLDYWDPTEKAQYPHYFARREAGKEMYIKLFEKRWGVNAAADLGVTHHLDVEDPETEEEKMYGKNGVFGKPVPVTPDEPNKKGH